MGFINDETDSHSLISFMGLFPPCEPSWEMCGVISISKYSPLNPLFLLPIPPPYPKLQQKKITSMKKGREKIPAIHQKTSMQTNK